MKFYITLIVALTFTACGTESKEVPPAPKVEVVAPVLKQAIPTPESLLPGCCEGYVSASPEAVLMCKVDAGGNISSAFVSLEAGGMVQTLTEMEYSKCEEVLPNVSPK